MRIGMGYDVHRLVEDRRLIMGGVEIPYEKGLLGHSDADVLLHAVMDALLGAAALGDIGKHFPDTDPAYRGISSLKLLERVGELLEEHSFLIENIDATIIAQAPKMRPHIDQMRENIARALKIDISQVNVKATTEEGLGFTGSGEGISSQAICLLNTPYGLYSEEMGNAACSGCGGASVFAKSASLIRLLIRFFFPVAAFTSTAPSRVIFCVTFSRALYCFMCLSLQSAPLQGRNTLR